MTIKLSHIEKNKAKMVDISSKKNTKRIAIAEARVVFSKKTFNILINDGNTKGEIFSTARIAGIQAAKKTSELIPLCHKLNLDEICVDFDINIKKNEIKIISNCKCSGKTGVEMEALVSVTNAALTIYDMCKSLDKGIMVTDVKLKFKSGGKSGKYKND